MASQAEVLEMVNTGKIRGIETAVKTKRRVSTVEYAFHFPKNEKKRLAVFEKLTKQGRALLELVFESKRETATLDTLQVIFEAGRSRVKVKEGRDLVALFGSHYKWTYKDLGLVSRTGDEDDEEEVETESEETE